MSLKFVKINYLGCVIWVVETDQVKFSDLTEVLKFLVVGLKHKWSLHSNQ